MICLKIHSSYRPVVAVCDLNLIGKKFESGILQLDCRENFYKGKEMKEPEVINTMQFQANEDATFNIIGEESIASAIKAGIIKKENVLMIKGIPFSLTLI